MGQQQLLLLVLSTIIVGLGVLAGLQAFDQKQTRANQDALIQDALRLFADAKGSVARPSHMGGVADFSAVTLATLNRDTSATSEYGLSGPVTTTPNGECAIESQTATTLTVACESDAATVTLSFDYEEDPEIQSTTVSVK
jgi:hypothetical protein